jgi:hypothetical protein
MSRSETILPGRLRLSPTVVVNCHRQAIEIAVFSYGLMFASVQIFVEGQGESDAVEWGH